MLLTFSFLAIAVIPQANGMQNTTMPDFATSNMQHASSQRLNVAAQEFALRLQVLRNAARSTKDVEFALDASISLFNEERPFNQDIAKRSHVRRMELVELAAREQFPKFTTMSSYERLSAQLQRPSEQEKPE